MTALFDSTVSPDVAERRNCSRQKVLFSSVVISENNCGRVLNISPNGLALQTDTDLVRDEFPNFRFKFSPSVDWVEARGRVAWRNDARNLVGIEFIGLTEEVQKQIRRWMDLKQESTEVPRPSMLVPPQPVAESEHTLDVQANTAVPETTQNLTPELADLDAKNKNESLVLSSAPSYPETGHAQVSVEKANIDNSAVGFGKAPKLVGLALAAIILLSVFLIRGLRSQKSANIQNGTEAERASQLMAPPSQPAHLATSAEHASAPTSQPTNSATSSAVRSSNQKPSQHSPAYVLQVAAMLHEENANALATELRKMSFPVFVMKLPNERFHHVLVGPFNAVNVAIETQNALEKHGYKTIRTEWKVPSA